MKIQVQLELSPEERRALEIQLGSEPLDRELAEQWVEGEVRARLAALARGLSPKPRRRARASPRKKA